LCCLVSERWRRPRVLRNPRNQSPDGPLSGASREELRVRIHGLQQASRDRAEVFAVPSAKLAGEELKTLTAEPHMAATPEDKKTADYVAQKFRAAGLDTEIVPYAC